MKAFVDAVMYDHETDIDGYEYAASTFVDYLEEQETPDRRMVMYKFIHELAAMVTMAERSKYCYCCGQGNRTLEPCPQCGEMLCQDCIPPFGGHVCGPD